MKFSEYYASFITPQMTLLEKYNAICKYLLDNEFKTARYLHIMRVEIKGREGTAEFNDYFYSDSKEKLYDENSDIAQKRELVTKLNQFYTNGIGTINLAHSSSTSKYALKGSWTVYGNPGQEKVCVHFALLNMDGSIFWSDRAYNDYTATFENEQKVEVSFQESVIEL